MAKAIKLFDRNTSKYVEEKVMGLKAIEFAYETLIGRILTKLILNKSFFSNIMRISKIKSSSRRLIIKFVEDYKINIDEIEKPLDEYKNFNDFFIRKLKPNMRNVDMNEKSLISPSDSRLICYDIQDNLVVPIKGIKFTIDELLKDKNLARSYKNGKCLIFRLAPVDYHRFCYTDNANQTLVNRVNGVLYSVNPIALAANFRIFQENIREYSIMKTADCGNILYMEVGAIGVGRIVQNKPEGGNVKRGEEKGYFEFGGSTIVMLYQKDKIIIDDDILENSKNGVETIVKYGSKIGLKSLN